MVYFITSKAGRAYTNEHRFHTLTEGNAFMKKHNLEQRVDDILEEVNGKRVSIPNNK